MKNLRIWLKGFLLTFVLIIGQLLYSSKAYANLFDFLNPVANFKKAIREFFSELATDFASFAFEGMHTYVLKVSDLSMIPELDNLVGYSQAIGASLATLFFIKRVVTGMKNDATGEDIPNYAEMFGSLILSMVFIMMTPYFIEHVLLQINNLLVEMIVGLGIDVNIGGHDIIDKFSITGDITVAGLHIIFILLVWVIAVLIFSIIGAIRYVDLTIVMILGPLVAASYSNRSEQYSTYWTETISIVFTQSIQALLCFLLLRWAANGTLLGIILSIAVAVVAIRGPQVLRQFLYTSGAGSGAGSVGRFAAYRMMLRGVGK